MVSYDPIFNGKTLNGLGTSTIEVIGHPVNIDTSGVSTNITLYGLKYWFEFGEIKTLYLPPDTTAPYRLFAGLDCMALGFLPNATFTVTKEGMVSYDPIFDGKTMNGLSTSTIEVIGYPITINATGASSNIALYGLKYYIEGVETFYLPPDTLIPYRIISAPGGILEENFIVRKDGTVDPIEITFEYGIIRLYSGGEWIDITPPIWTTIPVDQVLNEGENLYFNVSATDNDAISHYWLNDTSLFQIDNTGMITNSTALIVGIYNLEVFVNDTSGNSISASFSITIVDDDTEAPIITYIYTGDFTDANAGQVIFNVSDASGYQIVEGQLTFDVNASYTDEPQYFYLEVIDLDADSSEDSLTSYLNVSIIITDDDEIYPTIDLVEVETPILDNAESFWIRVIANDISSEVANVTFVYEENVYLAVFDGQYYFADLPIYSVGNYLVSIVVEDTDNDVPEDSLITIENYAISVHNIEFTISVLDVQLHHEMDYGFDVSFDVSVDVTFPDDFLIEIYFDTTQFFYELGTSTGLVHNFGIYTIVANIMLDGNVVESESEDFKINQKSVVNLILAQLGEINGIIDSSDNTDWNKVNYKKTFTNKLNALIKQVIKGEYEEAYEKLLFDIKPKLTGLRVDEWQIVWSDCGAFEQAWTEDPSLNSAFEYEINPTLWALSLFF